MVTKLTEEELLGLLLEYTEHFINAVKIRNRISFEGFVDDWTYTKMRDDFYNCNKIDPTNERAIRNFRQIILDKVTINRAKDIEKLKNEYPALASAVDNLDVVYTMVKSEAKTGVKPSRRKKVP